MSAVTLTSSRSTPLRPLVEAALQNELRLLQAAAQRTEQRLRAFELQHGMTSSEFITRYEADEFSETLEYAEWVGEYRLQRRLREKIDTLQEIRFAN